VARLAARHAVEIEESELIGLLPRKAMEMAFAHWLKLPAFDAGCVIETAIERALPLS
jgi:glutamate formiminotransferase